MAIRALKGVSSGDQTQVFKLSSTCIYPLSHLANPRQHVSFIHNHIYSSLPPVIFFLLQLFFYILIVRINFGCIYPGTASDSLMCSIIFLKVQMEMFHFLPEIFFLSTFAVKDCS